LNYAKETVGAVVSGAGSAIASGLSYFKGNTAPTKPSGSHMVGFGSEDL